MSCNSCSYPQAECLCCCKEKRYLDTYIKRLKAYECYLRPLVNAASINGLSNNIAQTNVASGANAQFGLVKANSQILAPSPFIGQGISKARLNCFQGCCCVAVTGAVDLKCPNDCYGIATEGPGIASYVTQEVGSNTGGTVGTASGAAILISGNNGGNTVSGTKGAYHWVIQTRKFYEALICGLDC